MQPTHIGALDGYILIALREGRLHVDPATGRVTNAHGRHVDEKRQNGYRRVHISRVAKTVYAHRVVWIACEGPIENNLAINHRNGIRDDNRICNLELVTNGENAAHANVPPYYNRLRDEDLEAVDPAWLEQVLALADRDNVTLDEINALRPEARGPVGSPEFTVWHDDQKVGHALHGRR